MGSNARERFQFLWIQKIEEALAQNDTFAIHSCSTKMFIIV